MQTIQLRVHGDDGYVLLAACADPARDGGGAYLFNGARIERLDRLDTSGFAASQDRLARLLWSETKDSSGLLVYDRWGVERYQRLDGLGDAHQAAWDGTDLVVVSTATNSIVWVSPNGVTREWKAPGAGDAWHLNGVHIRDGRIAVSAFGRFESPRGWDVAHRHDGSGIVFDLETGRDILTGLNCPHNPQLVGGEWIVCSAADHEILAFNCATGAMTRRLKLQGWTRGLAAVDDYLFAGVSAPRHDPSSAGSSASIAVLRRESWEPIGILPVESAEISELAVIPGVLAEGLRRGFSFKGIGVDQLASKGEAMLPLPPIARGRISVHAAALPPGIAAGEEFECAVRAVNNSEVALRSALPNPVYLSYRWLKASGSSPVILDGLRTCLTPALLSGCEQAYRARCRAPERPGRYRLRLTMVQEGVRWLDAPPTRLAEDVEVVIEESAER